VIKAEIEGCRLGIGIAAAQAAQNGENVEQVMANPLIS